MKACKIKYYRDYFQLLFLKELLMQMFNNLQDKLDRFLNYITNI